MPTRSKATEAATRAMFMLKSQFETQMDRQRTLLKRQAALARDRFAQNGSLNRWSDRCQMAENLHGIIAKAIRRAGSDGERVTKERIVAEAGMNDGRGKSSRLYDYALDPNLPVAKREMRAKKRLVKKPPGYLKLAESAARLANLDVDSEVVDLVQGTSLAEGMENLPAEIEPEYLTMLAKAIRGAARRIVEETDLAWYFRSIEEHGLVLSFEGWKADDDADMWTFLAIPWIDLFTEAVLQLPGKWYPNPSEDGCGEGGQGRDVVVCRRVGLALAPFGDGKAVRPYFVRRPVLLVRFPPWRAGDNVPPSSYFDELLINRLPDQSGTCCTANGRLVTGDVEKIWRSPCFIRPWLYYPGDDHEFIEVTPSSIAEILETEFDQAGLIKDDALLLPAAGYTKSPPGTRTAALERALLNGQSEDAEQSRLMMLLEGHVRDRVGSLRAWVGLQLARNEEAMIRMASGNAG
jgi:hypothetical protein